MSNKERLRLSKEMIINNKNEQLNGAYNGFK